MAHAAAGGAGALQVGISRLQGRQPALTPGSGSSPASWLCAQAEEARRAAEGGEAFRHLAPLLCGMLLGDAGLAVLLQHAVHAGLLPMMGEPCILAGARGYAHASRISALSPEKALNPLLASPVPYSTGRALAHVEELASESATNAAVLTAARDWLQPTAVAPSADAAVQALAVLLFCQLATAASSSVGATLAMLVSWVGGGHCWQRCLMKCFLSGCRWHWWRIQGSAARCSSTPALLQPPQDPADMILLLCS